MSEKSTLRQLSQIFNRISEDFASAAQLLSQLASEAAPEQAEASRPFCQTCEKKRTVQRTVKKIEKLFLRSILC